MSFAWINGQYVDESEASVSLRDTGLLHAAGVFTTMRADGGRVFRIGEHLKRLRASCEALFIPLNFKDEALKDAVGSLLQRNALSDARLRLTVTRGHATQDPLHGLRLEPTVFITATDLEPYPADFYQRGMTVVLIDEQKLNPYDIQAGHKTLNYFSRLAALREANRRGAGEALWFNVHNYLQSGSISNVFVVHGQQIVTPPTNAELNEAAVRELTPYPKSAVLPGITRQAVIDAAKAEGLAVRLAAVDVNLLLEADEAFLTNSIMQVMPVARVERREIGQGKPGEITQTLAARLSTMHEA
jgi:branched-chain amino acid aminotransferase